MRLLSLMLAIVVTIGQAQTLCDIQLIEEQAHFTNILDQNKSRECWFDMPNSPDVFLDIERYSDSKTLDVDAGLNFTFGDITVVVHNAYIQVGQHKCAVPMQTKLEQSIWIWFHFEDNAMTLQVSPANTAFFGHCLQVDGVEQTTDMHVIGWTRSGMEQVLRGVHADRPTLENLGQTTVMRKTIHELERRIHKLEEKQEALLNGVKHVNRRHAHKHHEHTQVQMNQAQKLQQTEEARLNDARVQNKRFEVLNKMGHHGIWKWLGFSIVMTLMVVLYRLWVMGHKQEKILKFKL